MYLSILPFKAHNLVSKVNVFRLTSIFVHNYFTVYCKTYIIIIKKSIYIIYYGCKYFVEIILIKLFRKINTPCSVVQIRKGFQVSFKPIFVWFSAENGKFRNYIFASITIIVT